MITPNNTIEQLRVLKYDISGNLVFTEQQLALIEQHLVPRPLGNRFEVRGGQIIKIANGEVLPVDEPLFLVRARDWLAVPALLHYKSLMQKDGCNDYILELMDEMLGKFSDFATQHPEKMKQPGVTRGR